MQNNIYLRHNAHYLIIKTMKKGILLFPLLASIISFIGCSSREAPTFSTSDDQAIKQLLAEQQDAWNKGDLAMFMEGYHRSDTMQFVGKNGIRLGWQSTFDRYRESYPDTVVMGKLRFEILKVNAIHHDAAFLTGKFFLKRSIGDAHGVFTLVLRKYDGKWVIVYDHTS